MKKTAAGVTQDMGPGIWNVLERDTLPDDDPRRISSNEQVLALAQPENGAWLTLSGVARVQTQLREAKKDTEGNSIVEIQHGQLADAKRELMFPESEYIKTTKGQRIYQRRSSQPSSDPTYDGLKADKTPYQLRPPEVPITSPTS
jgi:hypothetical protein